MSDKKYVLRLHEGSNNIEHWQKSTPINHKIADTIKDPEGAKLKGKRGEYNEVTSIPSPFARLELIKIAFKFVTENGLEGNTFYHKMVSDTLDIAQIFFNFYALQDQFEIIRWQSGLQKSGNDFIIQPKSDLDKLVNSSEPNQKLYGETLRLFIINDAKSDEPNFNFDLLEDIYLLNYKKGPDRLNIIGGTNPATLFWATPNPISYIGSIKFGNDQLFDDVFCPLQKREKDFVIFMYLLKNQIQNFAKRYPTLNQYMDACYKQLDYEVKQEIENRKWENYPDLKTAEGYTVKPTKDFSLKCKSNDIDEAQIKECDFYIHSERFIKLYPNKKIPVILPAENLNKNYKLFGTTWESNWSPVYYDEKPIEERSIPYLTGKQYPYLCISDFFHDYILKLPYKLNSDHFFTFTDKDSEYLIPLKPAVFDYFSLEELNELIVFDPKQKELKIIIPLSNNQTIEWSRTYMQIGKPDIDKNCGCIKELNVSFVCYPHFQFPQNVTPHKVVGLYCTDSKEKVSLNFYQVPNENVIENLEKTEFVKSKKQINDLYTSIYYNLEKDFEVIELVTEQTKALIFPKFKPPVVKENKQAIYALDFGTTNTHIEYKIAEEENQKFSWENLPWLHSLQFSDKEHLDEKLDIWRSIVYEFLPLFDKVNERYQFPIQSLIAYEAHFKEENKKLSPLTEMNIPYWYPYMKADHLKIESNIKWSEKSSNNLSKFIEGFLIQFLFMIRNHAIQNGIKPENVKLVSFYPHSMNYSQRKKIKSFIKEFFQRYISSKEDNIIFYPESITPYKYFTEKEGAFVVDGLGIHLDIGGGTTDMVFYSKSNYHKLSSIKFAGQDIFGDGYDEAKLHNGWVNYFSSIIHPKLREQNIQFPEAGSIPSTAYMNLLFNIHEAFDVKEKKLDISLAKEIDKTIAFKVIIFYHFAAIVYYLAKLQQQIYQQNPEQNQRFNTIPRFFTFSGRASQLLKIADEEGIFIKKLIREIYQDVLGISNENYKIELKFTKNPKEITCKGGIEMFTQNNDWDEESAENITAYWYGVNQNIQDKKFAEIENDKPLENEIAQSAYQFHQKFFEYMEEIKFNKEFGVDKSLIEGFQNIVDNNYMKDKLGRAFSKITNKDNEIEGESLFFYPLKQVLFDMGKLACEFSKNSPQ